MSAVLRAYGVEFDVDAFLTGCTLHVCAVRRRGELVFPASQPDGRRHEQSGVHVSASNADFGEFPRQVAEATAFLRAEAGQVRRLCEWPGVEDVTLDFGLERRDVAVQCDFLPPELVRLAGSLGLGVELSQYPAAGERQDAGGKADADLGFRWTRDESEPEAVRPRERAYLDILHRGLVLVRNLAHAGQTRLCQIEADHLHNIPTLLDETNERRHVFYIVQERGLYLERLQQFGATAYLEQVTIWYSEPWRVLARAAGVTSSD